MNWGLRITFLYLGFVALILTLVFTSMANKTELVATDYYKQELEFQERIDAARNANEAPYSISFELIGGSVRVQYPPELRERGLEGEIGFFRPSDQSKDFKVAMLLNGNGSQIVPASKFIKGMYKMQFSWVVDGRKYFKEETINI